MKSKEVRIQIALGTLTSDPRKLRKMLEDHPNTEIVEWMFKHKSIKVKIIAARSPLLSLSSFMRILLFEGEKKIKKAAGMKWSSTTGYYLPKTHPRHSIVLDMLEVIECKYNG